MERFYYSIKKKIQILDLVESGDGFRAAEQFTNITQKQLAEWKSNKEEMKVMSTRAQNSRHTSHKGSKTKYDKRYQFFPIK